MASSSGPGAQAEGGGERVKLRRCDIGGCSKPTLFAFTTSPEKETCEKCCKAFCTNHRYPDAHSCTFPVGTTPSLNSTARAILEKNFGPNLAASSSRAPIPRMVPYHKKKPPTDPRKLAQYLRVQLMKMRHSAVPADPKVASGSVPQELRLVIEVLYEGQAKVFWFNKNVSTGKAVDLLTFQFNITSSMSINLVKPGSGDDVILANDQPLASQAMDGESLALNISVDQSM